MASLNTAASAANAHARPRTITTMFAEDDHEAVSLLYEALADLLPNGEVRLLPSRPRGGPDTARLTLGRVTPFAARPDDIAVAELLCVLTTGVPACDPASAFVLLFQRTFGDTPRILQVAGPARDMRVGREIILRAAGVVVRPEVDLDLTAANDNVMDIEEPLEHLPCDVTLSALTYPGGFVEELIDWIVASAEHPSRELALSAVLPFLGALMGRRFSGYRDCRTNLYAIALAPSGYGKDHARSQIKRLIQSEHLHAFAGPARLMSATALRNALIDKPSINCMIDEIGGPLRGILDPRANVHQATLKDDLLDYFSSAATYFDGAAYAQARAVQIFNPNLCIYGTSTPDAFWAAVTGLQATDGFLARLLLFDVRGDKPELVRPRLGVKDIPKPLRDGVKAIAMAGRTGNLTAPALDSGERAVEAYPVPLSQAAERRRAAFKAEVAEHIKKADPRAESVLNRAVEHAVKLALIVAVGKDAATPKVQGADMDWACRLAWLSCCTVVREMRDNIADGPREANFGRIGKIIARAGAGGITAGRIADQTRNIDRRQREEILKDLEDAGRIKSSFASRGGRPGWIYTDLAAIRAAATSS